jgi:transcriptional regulator with XRE-family HTH domain
MAKKTKTKIKKAKCGLLGNNIRQYLIQKKMTQQQLAERIGTNRAHISRIINNRCPSLSVAIAMKISLVLEVPMDNLFIIQC